MTAKRSRLRRATVASLCDTVAEEDVVGQARQRVDEPGATDLVHQIRVLQCRGADRGERAEQAECFSVEREAQDRVAHDQPLTLFVRPRDRGTPLAVERRLDVDPRRAAAQEPGGFGRTPLSTSLAST